MVLNLFGAADYQCLETANLDAAAAETLRPWL
jgi:hypothetical protein